MAEQYRASEMCGPAIPLYRWTLGLAPYYPKAHSAFAWCLLHEGNNAEAKQMALDAMRFDGDVKAMRRIVFLADSGTSADARAKSGAAASRSMGARKVRDSSQKALGQAVLRRGR
jgi:hypothetical protein